MKRPFPMQKLSQKRTRDIPDSNVFSSSLI
jgi:hypothetical protein